jgi:hypothetical protein
VRWTLEELGEPYDIHYVTINPWKVPALRHYDVMITEAAVICTYLADEFPNAKRSTFPSATEGAGHISNGCSLARGLSLWLMSAGLSSARRCSSPQPWTRNACGIQDPQEQRGAEAQVPSSRSPTKKRGHMAGTLTRHWSAATAPTTIQPIQYLAPFRWARKGASTTPHNPLRKALKSAAIH